MTSLGEIGWSSARRYTSRQPVPPPHARPWPWKQVGIAPALMATPLVGGIYVDSTPLGNVVPTQTSDGDADLALQALAEPALARAPTGPWGSSAGVKAESGTGDGAGPGVQSPGSAGLPVTRAHANRDVYAPPAPTSTQTAAPACIGTTPPQEIFNGAGQRLRGLAGYLWESTPLLASARGLHLPGSGGAFRSAVDACAQVPALPSPVRIGRLVDTQRRAVQPANTPEAPTYTPGP
jgi:hypothetical protein